MDGGKDGGVGCLRWEGATSPQMEGGQNLAFPKKKGNRAEETAIQGIRFWFSLLIP